MDGFFKEKMVKKKLDNKELFIKSGIIAATAFIIFFCVGFVLQYSLPMAVFIFLMTVWGAWTLFTLYSYEYEYSYFDGDMDVALIMGKRRRKELVKFSFKDCEIVAPYTAAYKNEISSSAINKRIFAAESESAGDNYFAVFRTDGKKVLLVFQPDIDMLQDARRYNRSIIIGS